jgi:hypothetical protein
MLLSTSIHAIILALVSTAYALGCVPRPAGQYVQDTSFESPDDSPWTYGGAFLGSSPGYPALTGTKAM